MVAPGRADILLALEPAEALRFGHYLKDGGVSLVNTSIVLPVTVTTGRFSYPDLQEILAPLRRKGEVKAIAATSLAKKAGTPMAMNVVMLGALSAYLPLEEDYLLSALRSVIPSKYLEMNLRAYHFGKAEVE
jgi:indolepyruvate ferredoxin oxidoreductase beta subunit